MDLQSPNDSGRNHSSCGASEPREGAPKYRPSSTNRRKTSQRTSARAVRLRVQTYYNFWTVFWSRLRKRGLEYIFSGYRASTGYSGPHELRIGKAFIQGGVERIGRTTSCAGSLQITSRTPTLRSRVSRVFGLDDLHYQGRQRAGVRGSSTRLLAS
jgi:hypothetical protein